MWRENGNEITITSKSWTKKYIVLQRLFVCLVLKLGRLDKQFQQFCFLRSEQSLLSHDAERRKKFCTIGFSYTIACFTLDKLSDCYSSLRNLLLSLFVFSLLYFWRSTFFFFFYFFFFYFERPSFSSKCKPRTRALLCFSCRDIFLTVNSRYASRVVFTANLPLLSQVKSYVCVRLIASAAALR